MCRPVFGSLRCGLGRAGHGLCAVHGVLRVHTRAGLVVTAAPFCTIRRTLSTAVVYIQASSHLYKDDKARHFPVIEGQLPIYSGDLAQSRRLR